MGIVVVGSVALDTISAPAGRRERILGGSAVYSSLALAPFLRPRLVGVVGRDFPTEHRHLLEGNGVDLEGLEELEGDTFTWEGNYDENLAKAHTRATCLNVFGSFSPKLPPSYLNEEFLFLGNIDPDLQKKVLNQMRKPRLVATDTIELWIDYKHAQLKELLAGVQVFFINNEEAYKLTGEKKVILACRRIASWGPRLVVVKSGEHGAIAYDGAVDRYYMAPAYPDCPVVDPTGAGDSFAGGFLGSLLLDGDYYNADSVKRALAMGNVLASYTISQFSVEALLSLTKSTLAERMTKLLDMTQISTIRQTNGAGTPAI